MINIHHIIFLSLTNSPIINGYTVKELNNQIVTYIFNVNAIKDNGKDIGTSSLLDLENKEILAGAYINLDELNNSDSNTEYSINWDQSDSTHLAIDVIVKNAENMFTNNYDAKQSYTLGNIIITDKYSNNCTTSNLKLYAQLNKLSMTIDNLEINPSEFDMMVKGVLTIKQIEFIITIGGVNTSYLFDEDGNSTVDYYTIGFAFGSQSTINNYDFTKNDDISIINGTENNLDYTITKIDDSKLKITINNYTLITNANTTGILYLNTRISINTAIASLVSQNFLNIIKINIKDINLINKNTINDSQFYTSYNGNGVI